MVSVFHVKQGSRVQRRDWPDDQSTFFFVLLFTKDRVTTATSAATVILRGLLAAFLEGFWRTQKAIVLAMK